MHKSPRILFVCKRRAYGISYGLINSCQFICNMLHKHHIDAKVVIVDDNNDIDREIAINKPTHVIIEALWVVPEKFKILSKLHPHIKWMVRIHSKAPFLSTEGIATQWISEYIDLNKSGYKVNVSCNNKEFCEDLETIYKHKIIYLPNIYSPEEYPCFDHERNSTTTINIGCFGACRPHKNQYEQAIAAIKYANETRKHLYFHMNNAKIEMSEEPIIRNISALFAATNHTLKLHKWMPHHEFINLIKTMDVGMQVSFSESFNIVAADFAWNEIPIVVSPDIKWMSDFYKAEPTDTNSIVNKLEFAYNSRLIHFQQINKHKLKEYNKESTKEWLEHFHIKH